MALGKQCQLPTCKGRGRGGLSCPGQAAKDQSFWLPDNGFGGFVANFISEKLNIKNTSFGSYFSIIFLSISFLCFYLSVGLNIQEWKSILVVIKNLLIYFPKLIFETLSLIPI